MAWEIHDEYVKKRYVASACSCACLLYVASLVVLFLFPLLLAFASGSFWMKQKVYYDTPEVKFQSHLVVLIEGEGSVKPFQYMWTTSAALNDLIGSEYLMVPSVQASSKDSNADGFVDQVDLALSVTTSENGQSEGVRRVVVVAFFDYVLHGEARLNMDSLAILDASAPLPASKLTVVGDLVFKQRENLRVLDGYKKPYASTPLWDESKGLDGVQLANIVKNYGSRNFTTKYEYDYPMWTTDLTYGSTSASATTTGTFSLDMTVYIPSTVVAATPSASEMIKRAWMQYLSILAVMWVLVRYARIFVFGQKLVASTTVTDAVGKQHLH